MSNFGLALEHPMKVIYKYVKAGLVHGRRNCWFCSTNMIACYDDYSENKVAWKCPMCFAIVEIGNSTFVPVARISEFDLFIKLWIRNWVFRFLQINKVMKVGNNFVPYMRTLRCSLAHFWTTRVKPHLKLPGVVEIDETMTCSRRFSINHKFPIHRWLFGMLCRKTQIPVMYYIKNRRPHNIYPHLKLHLEPGSVVISDEHASYVNL